MPRIRKARAGSDSFGNEWPSDGAIVEVPVHQATALLAVPDGGFTEVQSAPVDTEDDPESRFAEVAPDADVSEAPKPRRGRPPKSLAASLIEE